MKHPNNTEIMPKAQNYMNELKDMSYKKLLQIYGFFYLPLPKNGTKKTMVPFVQGSLIAFDMIYSFHFHYVNNLYNKKEGCGIGEDQEKDCKHELTKNCVWNLC